ncbi:hypothetical protein ACJ2A9_12190 [Anaerobacillus sp. MEB173]|uniref:hypothetical protein n=1 Tax=Anaerobacillus sp. MEB173 TaxID=3383345 RepID=UPI003F8EC77D
MTAFKYAALFITIIFQVLAIAFVFINLTVVYYLLAGYALALLVLIGLVVRERIKEKKEDDDDDDRNY